MAAMLQVWKDQRLKDLGFRLVMQIHDELVLEGPEEHAGTAAEILQGLMVNPFAAQQFRLSVDLMVDVHIASNLAEAKG